MSLTSKIDNKTSRKRSRTKKAMSVARLIYFGLQEKMTIQFSKTRKSFYALKVLRGDVIEIEDNRYDMDNFVEISQKFVMMMEAMLSDHKGDQMAPFVIDKDTLLRYQLVVDEKQVNQLKNTNVTDSRNKESAFSNTLAWILLQKGYKLHYRTYNKKQSIKVINFYVWDGITTPDGVYYSIEDDTLSITLVKLINEQLSNSVILRLDHSFLANLDDNHQHQQNQQHSHQQRNSVFTPVVDVSQFSIIDGGDSFTHPFVHHPPSF